MGEMEKDKGEEEEKDMSDDIVAQLKTRVTISLLKQK